LLEFLCFFRLSFHWPGLETVGKMKLSPRHLIWVNLVLLALLAYAGASTVSATIAARLTAPPVLQLSPARAPIARVPHRPASYYASIHTRDIFNSTKPVVEAPPEPPPEVTELRLKLWGVALRTDDSSYCVIEDLTKRKQELFRLGAEITGGTKVKAIEWDRVILERNGREEFLEIEGPPKGRGGAPSPPSAARARRAQRAPAAAGGGIEKVSEDNYLIDRKEVDSALDNMNQLFTQIRAVPHFEGGASTGFRLFAIRQNSLFDRIGLRNGDVIQRVNGTDINDPSKALALFQELRSEGELTVEVVRNKKPKVLTDEIR
jgi:general secretion pathway protein C